MNGAVYLVKTQKHYFAMKVLRKNVVLEGQDVAYVMLERDILVDSQKSPFIVQLLYSFQNAERLFFLMEVAQGGNFYRLLQRQASHSPFSYNRIQFHSGEIVCALEYLHHERIVRIE
ncbi:unnamed protein product [Didymodactylos carnosus]|uniref:non-specific serine/threonine protein kinase n=1 Tax=Didymodactylos carnosus TaxID=1234261 RepID=A0A8S2XAY3_9BILA|nr:unnamed protein product [Didymodactylos carnosus]CAF4484149.1 unnamed protein product [Didymodactylos carnosus]